MDKLASHDEDDNINSSYIIIDMLEFRHFFNVLSHKEQVEKLIKIINEADESSTLRVNSALRVLIAELYWYQEKHRNSSLEDSKKQDDRGGDDDEETPLH